MRVSLFLLLLLGMSTLAQQTPPASRTQAIYQAEANSAQRKFDFIRQNALRNPPRQAPTTITENEINAWLSSGQAQLPKGVKKLQLHGQPGVVTAHAVVDFDEITAGRHSGNPFLSIFSGTHDVDAEAHGEGEGGEGRVHIDSVSLDGVEIPRMALQFFVDKYVTPKHPGIGLDSTFKLPYRIDAAMVGSRQLAVLQK
jgi:hypothetical protein